MGMIGGILIIIGSTIKAIDELTNNKQEMIKNGRIKTL